MTVVTVTLNPCIDKTCSVERVADRKLRAAEVRLYPGGGGVNVTRAVLELGGDARGLWTLGGSVAAVTSLRCPPWELSSSYWRSLAEGGRPIRESGRSRWRHRDIAVMLPTGNHFLQRRSNHANSLRKFAIATTANSGNTRESQ